uniref:Cytochrome c biogenesis protein Ccs1 n=1 Tax=Platysiphonia delicata TaxID=2006979 RepID=A0A1Z1M170_9FLOR|nr:cytochrome c biogenesis protein ccs1 [Platysiphonia delicata]ARW59514.1 cytochrome c biogenesis protein ccs1 [Platysiphonia delicata]
MLNPKKKVWKIFKSLANLNISILILFVICFLIMLGSLIEQNKSVDYYKFYYPIDDHALLYLNWKLILFLGLNHLYETWWFLIILSVFGSSLIVCTFSVQLPSLKSSRRWKFSSLASKSFLDEKIVNSFVHSENSIINIIYSLNFRNFYVFHKEFSVYGYKGILGRLSPVFVHISIIVILIGSVTSSFLSFHLQEMIPVGELFHLKNFINSGFYGVVNNSIIGKIDDFSIAYNIDSSIKQFSCNISLFNNQGKLLINKVIKVNDPLKFASLTFYQTDWEMNAVRLCIGLNKRTFFQLKLIKTAINNKSCWFLKLPLKNNQKCYIVIFDLQSPFLVINSDGQILKSFTTNDNFYINHTMFSLKSVLLDTGLQIKSDPGIVLVYTGFFFLMLTTITSYSSYNQIWIFKSPIVLSFSAVTNRAIFFFEEDLVNINRIYYFYTFKFIKSKYPKIESLYILER